MTRSQLLALLGAGLLAAGGVAALSLTDPKTGEEVTTAKTWEGLLFVDCLLAKADDKTASRVECQSGEVVTRVRWRGTEIPEGYQLVADLREVADQPTLKDPEALPLASDCVAGELRKDTSERADGSQWWYAPVPSAECDRARLRCRLADRRWVSVAEGIAAGACWETAPVELSGRETWRTRVVERRPELVGAEAAPTGVEEP